MDITKEQFLGAHSITVTSRFSRAPFYYPHEQKVYHFEVVSKSETKPYFEDEILTQVEKVQCKEWSYKLPEMIDPLGKEVAFSYYFEPETISSAATYD